MNSENKQAPISIAKHTKFANPATRVAIEHEGKYLLVQEGKEHVRGLWAFPGGKVDVDESLIESAKREIREETGIEVELMGLITAQWVLWGEMSGFTVEFGFMGRAISIPESFPVCEEVLAVEWKTMDEIKQIEAMGLFRNPGQAEIARAIMRGVVMPMESIMDRVGFPPPEARW